MQSTKTGIQPMHATLTAASPHATMSADIVGMQPALELISLLRKKETELQHERDLRIKAEQDLQEVIADRDRNWIRRKSQEERDAEDAARQQRQITGVKSDGKPIAQAAEGLTSYTDITTFLAHLKTHGRMGVRNWAMFRVGICLGIRVSDLMRLKWFWLKNQDGSWRKRLKVVEKKTSKLNNILITPAVKETLDEYAAWLGDYDLQSPVFAKSTGEPMTKQYASDLLREANKICGIEKHISSHTMRKTFANIVVACYDGSMEMEAIDRVRSLLNHESLTTTSHYLGIVRQKDDAARESVSDFILGKTDIETLAVPTTKSNNDIYDLLQQLQEAIQNGNL